MSWSATTAGGAAQQWSKQTAGGSSSAWDPITTSNTTWSGQTGGPLQSWGPDPTTIYSFGWLPHWDYDPSRLTLSSGSSVSSLTDFSRHDFHATQATASRQPTLIHDMLNGLSGLSFVAASSQRLQASFTDAIAQPATMFIVGKTGGANQYFCDGIANGSRMAILRTSAGNRGLVTQGVQLSDGADDGEFAIITALFNGDDSLLRVNGVTTTGSLGDDSLGGLIIGGNVPLNAFLNGAIVRFIGYAQALSTAQILHVEQYLRSITGIEFTWVVTYSKDRYIYQRLSPSTDLALVGQYMQEEGPPSGIEARYKGGAWTNINAVIADGAWSGTLPAQTDGQGTLEVRRSDTPDDTISITNIGVGDVFLVAGQSNAEGHFDNNQSYSHGSLSAAVWRQTSVAPADLTDPTDSDSNDGSVWPPLATLLMADQSVPVMFITTAQSNSGLVLNADGDVGEWTPNGLGDAYEECISVVASAGHARLKAILWYQGETDASQAVTAAEYKAALTEMLDSFQIDARFDLNDDPIVEDAFTAANGTTLHGRTPPTGPNNWVVRTGSIQVQSNRLERSGTASPGHIATVDSGEADVRITATMNLPSGDAAALVLRYNPADGSHYLCRFQAGGSGNELRLFYSANGTTYSELGSGRSATIPADTDFTAEAALNGSVLVMRYGTRTYRWESADQNPTITHHGIFFASAADGPIDDFVARAIVKTPLICAQIGRRTDGTVAADTDAIRTAQYELPDEDEDIFLGPLTHDGDFADDVHWSTDAQATVLAGRWMRAIDDALYGGTNGTGPEFASAAQVDATHIDVVFTFPGSATSLVVGAAPTVGWQVYDDGVLRAVSAVALQSATTLRLTTAALSGVITISFGSGNESSGTTIADNHAYPLPPVPFLNQAVS